MTLQRLRLEDSSIEEYVFGADTISILRLGRQKRGHVPRDASIGLERQTQLLKTGGPLANRFRIDSAFGKEALYEQLGHGDSIDLD